MTDPPTKSGSERQRLTGAQRFKRVFALIYCSTLGGFSAMIHSAAWAHSRRLSEKIALAHAWREALWWTGVGLGLGLLTMRVMQSARLLELVLIVVLIFLCFAW